MISRISTALHFIHSASQPRNLRAAYNLALKSFEKSKNNWQKGDNLYLHPEVRQQFQGADFHTIQKETQALIHGARNPQTVLDAAKQTGQLAPGKDLHVVPLDEIAVARMIAGPSGVMVLIKNEMGAHTDIYGSTHLANHLPKTILGIWKKDEGRICSEIAAYRAIKVFFSQLNEKKSDHSRLN
ncbi:MAG: hypothetical protein ACOYK9_03730 [Chlamydiia bacterium]